MEGDLNITVTVEKQLNGTNQYKVVRKGERTYSASWYTRKEAEDLCAQLEYKLYKEGK